MLMNMLRVPTDKSNMPNTDEPMTPPMSPIAPLIRMIMNMLRVPADEPSMPDEPIIAPKPPTTPVPVCPICCYRPRRCVIKDNNRKCFDRNICPRPPMSTSAPLPPVTPAPIICPRCCADRRGCSRKEETKCRNKYICPTIFKPPTKPPTKPCPDCCHPPSKPCKYWHDKIQCRRCPATKPPTKPPCPKCCSTETCSPGERKTCLQNKCPSSLVCPSCCHNPYEPCSIRQDRLKCRRCHCPSCCLLETCSSKYEKKLCDKLNCPSAHPCPDCCHPDPPDKPCSNWYDKIQCKRCPAVSKPKESRFEDCPSCCSKGNCMLADEILCNERDCDLAPCPDCCYFDESCDTPRHKSQCNQCPTCPTCCSQGDCNDYLQSLCVKRDCLSRKINVNPFPSCCLSDSCTFYGDKLKCPSYLSNYCIEKLTCCSDGSCRDPEDEKKCFKYNCPQPNCPKCCHWQHDKCATGLNLVKCPRCQCPSCCYTLPIASCGFFENFSLCRSCPNKPIFNLFGK